MPFWAPKLAWVHKTKTRPEMGLGTKRIWEYKLNPFQRCKIEKNKMWETTLWYKRNIIWNNMYLSKPKTGWINLIWLKKSLIWLIHAILLFLDGEPFGGLTSYNLTNDTPMFMVGNVPTKSRISYRGFFTFMKATPRINSFIIVVLILRYYFECIYSCCCFSYFFIRNFYFGQFFFIYQHDKFYITITPTLY